MRRFKKITLALSAMGLLITFSGAVLLSQGSSRLGRIGQPLHSGGLFVMLAALCIFLYLSVIERQSASLLRQTWKTLHARPTGTVPTMRPSISIIVARVMSIILIIMGVGFFSIASIQFTASFTRLRGGGGILFYGLSSGMTTFACGLALWLIADIAHRVRILCVHRSREDRPIPAKEIRPATPPKTGGDA